MEADSVIRRSSISALIALLVLGILLLYIRKGIGRRKRRLNSVIVVISALAMLLVLLTTHDTAGTVTYVLIIGFIAWVNLETLQVCENCGWEPFWGTRWERPDHCPKCGTKLN
jgi:hypothetical protein